MKPIKEKLEQIKASDDQNLYQHLTKLLTKFLIDNPKNAYEYFEDYSYTLRSGIQSEPERPSLGDLNEFSQQQKKLLSKINLGTVEEPQEAGPCGYVPNMIEEARWFEWAGVSFGQEETLRIFKSLTLLSVQKQAKQLRLWGKIFGSKKDYYIAEGIAEGGADDADLPPIVEPKGTGVNKMQYWTTNDIIKGDWVELPIVTPQQVQVSRKIKHIFSGNLEDPIYSNPFFPGKEKHLLKCQITRIVQSTQIVPKGMFIIREDDNKEIDPAEEYKFPNFWTLTSLESWVHINPAILKCGRQTHQLPADLDPEKDPDKEMALLVAKDPYEPRLKPLSQDKLNGNQKAWKIKVQGDACDYQGLSKDPNNKVNYGVIVIKSLVWPGLSIVYSSKQWQFIYVGQGFKNTEDWYYPNEPQLMLEEADDKPECPEPNFPKEEKIDKPQDEPVAD